MTASRKFAISDVERPDMGSAPSTDMTGHRSGKSPRPHQNAVALDDLTQQERDELANLLEAEFARL